MMLLLLSSLLLVERAVGHGGERVVSEVLSRNVVQDESLVMSKFVNYTVDGEVYEGYAAWPKYGSGMVPGFVIVHQWYGLGSTEMTRAQEAAEHGYLAMAVDVYGYGKRASNNAEAGALSGAARADEAKLLKVTRAGVDAMRAFADQDEEVTVEVLSDQVVATGYCFGGGVLLSLGRDGGHDGLQGIATFHASLPEVSNWSAANLKVQIHHGQLDFAGDENLFRVWQGLKDGNVQTWESAYYANAQHGFSDFANPAYDVQIAKQSHDSMFAFFNTYLALGDTWSDAVINAPTETIEVNDSKKKKGKKMKGKLIAIIVLAVALGLTCCGFVGFLGTKKDNKSSSREVDPPKDTELGAR